MNELYSQQDLQAIQEQLKKRKLVLGLVSLLLIAVLVLSLIRRVEWLTTLSLILFGSALIFGIEMFLRPLIRYQKLILSALNGRSHTETLIYDHPEPDLSMVDGVSCRSLVFLGTPDKHGTRDQMYYLDALKPFPEWRPGESLQIRYTGKMILAWSPAAGQ